MKARHIISVLSAALLCSASFAGGLSERVFITTDSPVYVAGDRMFCSAFCIDASTGGFSNFSSIAYLELHSATDMVFTGRIALQEGRGAATFQLPAGIPTGNYRILCYTAQNRNEEGFDSSVWGPVVSVFNTASTARVPGGVEIGPALQAASEAEPCGSLEVLVPADAARSGRFPLTISNKGGEPVTVSVSVRREDGIPAPASVGPAAFAAALKPGKSFVKAAVPEYEGEIIRGRVVGLNPAELTSINGKCCFISAPGEKSDIYSAMFEEGGAVNFFTSNIYGSKDLVCEIEGLGSDTPGHIEIDSPFVCADPGTIPTLHLDPSFSEALQRRGMAARITRKYDADTLYEYLPVRPDPLFDDEPVTYLLDDYTRFPLMEEVFVEFVSEVRARRNGEGNWEIFSRVNDLYESSRYAISPSLVMIDGVPVFDHNRVMAYDPLLVEKIIIYPDVYFIGDRSFEGIVNLVTYKRNLPAVEFDANVRIVDFQGCPLPVAYTCEGVDSDPAYPDYRQTAYWHPLVEVGANEKAELWITLPSTGGPFRVEVSGFSADGAPNYCNKLIR